MSDRDKSLMVKMKTFYDQCASCTAITKTEDAGAPLQQPDYEAIFATVPSRCRKEEEMYEPLCAAINALGGGKFVCKVSSNKPDPGDPTLKKVDLSIFPRGYDHEDGCPHWPDQLMNVEVKAHEELDDPFDDEGEIFQTTAEHRDKVRQQLASYAEMLFTHQPRSFCFTVVVYGRCARIMRWDRSGAIVTETIDWVLHPEQLGRLFWRLSEMTQAEQGYDTTVTEVTAEEREKMFQVRKPQDLPRAAAYPYIMFAKSLKTKRALMKVRVDVERTADDLTPTHKGYLVGEPMYAAPGLTGRSTRTYVALDALTNNRLVWLKDAWRVGLPGLRREGDTLLMLKEANVENVPTFECHGDVPGQATLADKIWPSEYYWPSVSDKQSAPASGPPAKSSADVAAHAGSAESRSAESKSECGADAAKDEVGEQKAGGSEDKFEAAEDKPEPVEDEGAAAEDGTAQTQGVGEIPPLLRRLKPHVHYRLVVEEVCLPLDDFCNGRELMQILLHCVIALQQAYEILSLLHRDVSHGNVLIFVEVCPGGKIKRRGILSDWELAKVVDKTGNVAEVARQPDRTGTWRFLSALSLTNSRKRITHQDDLESIWHLTIFESSRWFPSTLVHVAHFIYNCFDARETDPEANEHVCGPLKIQTMTTGQLEHRHQDILFFARPGDDSDADPHPLNIFLEETLTMFHAYYAVIKHVAPWVFTPGAEPKDTEWIVNAGNKVRSARRSKKMDGFRKDAARLNDHNAFVNLMKECVDSPNWGNKDKLQKDRWDKPWDPAAADPGVGNSSALTQSESQVPNHSAAGVAGPSSAKVSTLTSQLMSESNSRPESSTGSMKRRRSVSQMDEPGPSTKRRVPSITVPMAHSQSVVSDVEVPPPSPSSEEDEDAVGRDSPTRRLQPGSRRGSNRAGLGSGQAKRGR